MKWLNDNWFKLVIAALVVWVSIVFVGYLKAERQQAGRLDVRFYNSGR